MVMVWSPKLDCCWIAWQEIHNGIQVTRLITLFQIPNWKHLTRWIWTLWSLLTWSQPALNWAWPQCPLKKVSRLYYLPEKVNQVAISSFIVSGGYVYFFQFTISEEQEVKPGLKAFLKTFPGIQAEANLCFVFVIPTDKDMTCSQPKELGTLPLYSAAIDIELYSKSASV